MATAPDWFETFTDAIAAGEQTYLVCEDCGSRTLPPRELCPACASTALADEPLPERGTVQSFTEISVTTPKFEDETPYTVALVEFTDGVVLTGQVRGGATDACEIGDEVVLGTEARDDGASVLTFRRVED